ncbi:hypothetical protein [Natronobeatus ordinarius]|uniref:hypothetical protein n=1 Tax=Natronobeatus ordinarius TaxID=2963433 RepID=UPI0020CBD822|nr:hypothetical protein [Natronobeatus ordinarius]
MVRHSRRSDSSGRRGSVARVGGYLIAVVGVVVFLAGVVGESFVMTVGLVLVGLLLFAAGLTLARVPWYVEAGVGVLLRLLP